jgi:hypothetical protein
MKASEALTKDRNREGGKYHVPRLASPYETAFEVRMTAFYSALCEKLIIKCRRGSLIRRRYRKLAPTMRRLPRCGRKKLCTPTHQFEVKCTIQVSHAVENMAI